MSDNWDFYFSHIDDAPGTIFVDLGINSDAPIIGLTESSWLRVYMKEPLENGFLNQSEHDTFLQIEDALSDAIDSGNVIFVGRVTSNGYRDFFFYNKNHFTIENYFSSIMTGYSEYKFKTESKTDTEWETYFQFLYPSEREYQMIMTGRVFSELEELGDKKEIEREIRHWAEFELTSDLSAFLDDVTKKNYKKIEQNYNEEKEKFVLILSCKSTTNFMELNDIALELFDLALKHNGEYDGWETSVEKDIPE